MLICLFLIIKLCEFFTQIYLLVDKIYIFANMNDTRSEILRLGEEFIRTKGYNAFSYADIAEIIKIRKATIHYYFPTKADLGTEIIKNTIQNFHNAVNNWEQYPYEIQLKHWILLYADSRKKNWVCITGALSPVFDTLPTKMQVQLQILVNDIFNWLEEVLSKGKEAGVFHFNESPQLKAHIIQSLLLASLLLDKVVAKDIYEEMKSHILGI